MLFIIHCHYRHMSYIDLTTGLIIRNSNASHNVITDLMETQEVISLYGSKCYACRNYLVQTKFKVRYFHGYKFQMTI